MSDIQSTQTSPQTCKDDEGVYLCQVGPHTSCGACCGLYNVSDLTYSALNRLLMARTETFNEVTRSPDHLDDFARRQIGFTPPDRFFPHFHHCPFLGLIDSGNRVGCLLHPRGAGNDGVDWRALSYYGGRACRTYFCPTMTKMPGRHKKILINAFQGWFCFGLVLTERPMLAAIFNEIEDRIGRAVGPSDFPHGSTASLIFSGLCDLKLSWPFRRSDAPGPANFFFENGDYERAATIYPDSKSAPSRFDTLFLELESRFNTADDQETAEGLIEAFINDLVYTVTKRRLP